MGLRGTGIRMGDKSPFTVFTVTGKKGNKRDRSRSWGAGLEV